MSELKLAIGMAVYDDLPGVWMTVQALRLYHGDILHQCELIVVDNHPISDHGRSTENLIRGWVRGDFLKVQYVPFTEYNSTARPRQMVFELAEAPNVLVIDSHIMLPRKQGEESSLARLIRYYDEHPDTFNLLQGPLVYDNLVGLSTHFQDVMREEMWGIWGTDPRASDPNGEPFEIPAQGLGLFSARKDAWMQVGGFNPLFRGFGGEEWYIHQKFRKHGAEHGVDGRTLCLPWLPWLHRFGHAGGVKYPLSVLDKLRNYIIGQRELADNELLKRLVSHFVGMKNEDGTERKGPRITPEQWNEIVRNPTIYPIQSPGTKQPRPSYIPNPNPGSCGNTEGKTNTTVTAAPVVLPPPEVIPDLPLSELPTWLSTRPDGYSDLIPMLVYFQNAKRILFILQDRIEPVIATINYPGERRIIINDESQPLTRATMGKLIEKFSDIPSSVAGTEADIISLWQDTVLTDSDKKITTLADVFNYMNELQSRIEVDEDNEHLSRYYDLCDLVVIQGRHHGMQLLPLLLSLNKIATGRIVIFGSHRYGEMGPANPDQPKQPQPGIRPAVRNFCVSYPEWSVVKVLADGVGCIVLSRLKEDKKPLPPTWQMAINFAKAETAYVMSGMEKSTAEEFKTRLAICSDCEFRNEDRCGGCGCYIVSKAEQAVQECPFGFWKDQQRRKIVNLPVVEMPAS